MKQLRFAAIGDVGFDMYPQIHKRFPGGMALNSAVHAARAGAIARTISAVGDDEEGKELMAFLQKQNVKTDGLTISPGKTDTVEITLDENGSPEYGTWDLGVLESFTFSSKQIQLLEKQDIAIAVHLPELRHLFDGFAGMNLPHTQKVGDFTDLSEYGGDQTILEEYVKSFDIFALSIDTERNDRLASFQSFISAHDKMGIALLGKNGSQVFYKKERYIVPAKQVAVIDTTGAGDTYLSTFLVHYFISHDILSAMKKATQQASQTIQHRGGVAAITA